MSESMLDWCEACRRFWDRRHHHRCPCHGCHSVSGAVARPNEKPPSFVAPVAKTVPAADGTRLTSVWRYRGSGVWAFVPVNVLLVEDYMRRAAT